MSVLMKPSGIEWIGDIPESWTDTIIKRYYEIQLGKMLQPQQSSNEDTEEYYLRSANLAWTGIKLSDVKKMWFKPFEKINYSIQYGDLLVSEGGDVGRSSIWYNNLENCYFQNAINRVRARHNNDTKFLYYWMHMLKHSGYIDAIVSRITIAHLTAEKLEKLPFLCPPPLEQKSISNFLDKSTAKIENAIKTKQAQLKTLETLKKSIIHKAVTKGLDDSVTMKDSGIEWVGEIPEHWSIERIKDLSAEITGGGTPKSSIDEYWEDGNIIWMTPTDFQDFEDTKYINDSKRKITEIGLRKCSAKLLPINTVVMSSRASIGTPKLTSVELSTNQGFISFLPSFRLNNNFLYYCIEGYLGSYFQIIASGTTFMEISPKIAKQEKIPLPSMKEQEEISLYLDKEVKKMNTLKSNVQNQINKLKEYKKSLIYEYVTGKKQVKE